ncbi:MAG: type II toxin-antitoxin system Phd/YefM family antitoxin [Actinomycetia bacterium]|nr:type II toxin-antitoxin system Phd/YefM family antitoxin [Actinomycetes bacterium]
MKYIALNEARTHFSRLMRRVAAGEEITISRRGTPVARLVPIGPSDRRQLGIDEGQFTVPRDFNDPIEKDRRDLTKL